MIAPRYQVEVDGDQVLVWCKSPASNYPAKVIEHEPITVELQLANLRQAMAEMDEQP